MAEFKLEPQALPMEQPNKDQVFKNVKSVQVGAGYTQFNASREGIHLGAEKFADAPFSVDMEGRIKANAGTFAGKVEIKDGSGNVVILIDPNG